VDPLGTGAKAGNRADPFELATPTPWRQGVLIPLVTVLVIHSINPLLRGIGHSRKQLPGFSYDFVTSDTVPLVAPIVVGVPTLAALSVFTLLQRWTGVPSPRWAAWTMLIPVLTTVLFAVLFFVGGSIVTTRSEIVHSRGLGMLVETVGMSEPVPNDHFRYRRPAGNNYSHTIYPFWEPWAILLTSGCVAALGLRFAWRQPPSGLS